MNLIKVGKGKTLFQEGDKGDYICFVIGARFEKFGPLYYPCEWGRACLIDY